jgi:S1-C subfamily serine protease
MLVGYMRVSTDGDRQVMDLQRDALLAAGVDERHPGSQAEDKDIKPGDVIEQVDHHPATTPDDVMDRLAHRDPASGDRAALLVRSKSATRWDILYVGPVDVSELVAPAVAPNASELARDAAAGQR